MSKIGSLSGGSFTPPGTLNLNYTLVTTSPYVVLANDSFLGVDTTTIPITINLPDAPATGRIYVVKDIIGLASTNNITITTVSGLINIDNATTFVMNSAFQSVQLLFNGSAYLIF